MVAPGEPGGPETQNPPDQLITSISLPARGSGVWTVCLRSEAVCLSEPEPASWAQQLKPELDTPILSYPVELGSTFILKQSQTLGVQPPEVSLPLQHKEDSRDEEPGPSAVDKLGQLCRCHQRGVCPLTRLSRLV